MADKNVLLQNDTGDNLLPKTKPSNLIGFENKTILTNEDLDNINGKNSLWKTVECITNNGKDKLYYKVIDGILYIDGYLTFNQGDCTNSDHRIFKQNIGINTGKNIYKIYTDGDARTPKVLSLTLDGGMLFYFYGDTPKPDETYWVPIHIVLPVNQNNEENHV